MSAAPRLPDTYRLVRLARIGSTNDTAKRLGAEGAPESVVWALEQDGGRGRRGRAWVSPPGNLYCSLLLRPDATAAAAAQLGFAAALAVAEAFEPFLPAGPALRCKWPNDVLAEGRKLAGILLESEARGDGRLAWLVVGIGVNLASFPETSERPATSLAAEGGGEVDVAVALEAVVRHFDAWRRRWAQTGFAALRQAWLARAANLGQAIEVRLDRQVLQGRFADLDGDGALLIDTAEGRRRVAAGEVFPAAAA